MRRGGACPAVLQKNRQKAVREGLLFVFHDKFIVIYVIFYYNIKIESEIRLATTEVICMLNSFVTDILIPEQKGCARWLTKLCTCAGAPPALKRW